MGLSDSERTDVIFGAKIEGLLSGMKEAQGAVAESTEAITACVEGMAATCEAAVAPLVALAAVLEGGEMFKEAIEKTAELGKQLEVLSQKTGMSGEELSRWQYAANLSDVSAESLTMGFTRLARAMEGAEKGSGAAADAFERLGIKVTTADGTLRPMQQVLLDVADKFHGMEDGAGKTALALDLFGRSGAAMIPFLNQGREGISALNEEADRLGVTMNEQGIVVANEYVDAMKRWHAEVDGVARQIALGLMPALTQLATSFTEGGAAIDAYRVVGEVLGNVLKEIAIAYHAVALAARLFQDAMTGGKDTLSLAIADLKTFKAALDDLTKKPTGLETDPAMDALLGGKKKPAPPAVDTGDLMQRFEAQWAAMKEKNADNFGALAAMELTFWQGKLGMVDAGSKEALAIHRRIAELTVQVDKSAYDGQLAALHAREVLDKEHLEDVLADRQAELEIIRKHYAETSKEVQEGLKRVNEVEEQMQKASAKQWETAFNAIPSAFSHATSQIGKSVMSLSDLFRTFFRDLSVMAIESAASTLAHHVAMELGKTGASAAGAGARVGVAAGEQTAKAGIEQTGLMHHYAVEIAKVIATVQGAATRVAVESAAMIATVAKSVWAAIVQIANYAAVAAAASWAAIAGIPFIGPFLAPAMAVGAIVGVMGLAGSVKSAAGGYDIPAGINPVTQLHAQEMVLPAPLANAVRDMAAGGGGGGGGTHLHVHATYADAAGIRRLFIDNAAALADGIHHAAGRNMLDARKLGAS